MSLKTQWSINLYNGEMSMDFNGNKPIYLQLADQLMDELASGELQPGDRLPSVRDYAARVGVNVNTVMRTYSQMQQDGIIYNQRGIGYFYTEDALKKVRDMRRREFFDRDFPYLVGRINTLGITQEELVKAFRQLNSKNNQPENI